VVQKRLWGGYIPTSLREAVIYVGTMFRRKYGWIPVTYGRTYNGRHGFIVFHDMETGGRRRVYVVFQREPLHLADKLLGMSDKALTINLDALRRVVSEGYDFIVWIDKNGMIRMVSPIYMAMLVDKNRWVRTTRSGETTAHIPIGYTYVVS